MILEPAAALRSSPLLERVRASVIGSGRVRRSVRPAPVGLCRLHRQRPLVVVHRGFHPRTGAAGYANTHTSQAEQVCRPLFFARDARRIVRDAVEGNDDTVIVFCGSGATSAIDKMVRILGLRFPRSAGAGSLPPDARPVIFIGPYEHHSNELPWRESIADVVTITGPRRASTSTLSAPSWSLTPTGHCVSVPSRPPPTSPASSPTPGRSLGLYTSTARCPSGTSPPRALCRDRHEPRRRSAGVPGRGVPLAAQVRRWPGHAGGAGCPAGTVR